MPKFILGFKFYTTKEVAELLGLTYGTVNKYMSEGRLVGKTIGGRKYVSEDNLKDFLQNDK